MKKYLCLGLSAMMMLSLTACQSERKEALASSMVEEAGVTLTEDETLTFDHETSEAQESIVSSIEDETKESTEEAIKKWDDGWSEKIPWRDLDGDGTEEYILLESGDFLDQNLINGRITMYVNNESVYQYTEELHIIDVGDKAYLDLDGDGEEEIFVSFWPAVNSAGLEEWFVLKKKGDTWERLEMFEDMPITIVMKEKDFGLAIRCEGWDGEIPFDATKHYEAMKVELDYGNTSYNDFMDAQYNVNDGVGSTMAYGIWEIIDGGYQGENCLIASNGICGPGGRYDVYGGTQTYFNYDENGKIKILGMEFEPVEY